MAHPYISTGLTKLSNRYIPIFGGKDPKFFVFLKIEKMLQLVRHIFGIPLTSDNSLDSGSVPHHREWYRWIILTSCYIWLYISQVCVAFGAEEYILTSTSEFIWDMGAPRSKVCVLWKS